MQYGGNWWPRLHFTSAHNVDFWINYAVYHFTFHAGSPSPLFILLLSLANSSSSIQSIFCLYIETIYSHNSPHFSTDGGSMFFWNVSNTADIHMVQPPRSRINSNKVRISIYFNEANKRWQGTRQQLIHSPVLPLIPQKHYHILAVAKLCSTEHSTACMVNLKEQCNQLTVSYIK